MPVFNCILFILAIGTTVFSHTPTLPIISFLLFGTTGHVCRNDQKILELAYNKEMINENILAYNKEMINERISNALFYVNEAALDLPQYTLHYGLHYGPTMTIGIIDIMLSLAKTTSTIVKTTIDSNTILMATSISNTTNDGITIIANVPNDINNINIRGYRSLEGYRSLVNLRDSAFNTLQELNTKIQLNNSWISNKFDNQTLETIVYSSNNMFDPDLIEIRELLKARDMTVTLINDINYRIDNKDFTIITDTSANLTNEVVNQPKEKLVPKRRLSVDEQH